MYSSAIQERSITDLDAIKRRLRLPADDTSEDEDLEDLLAEVKSLADAYCSNRFVTTNDDDEEEEIEIPRFVEGWIKRKVASYYEFREGGVVSRTVAGLGSVRLTDQDKADLFPAWKSFI